MKDNVIEFRAPDIFGYTVIYEPEIEDLNATIEGYIEEGWRPYGAPFVAAGGDGYCQAMRWVKPKKGADRE